MFTILYAIVTVAKALFISCALTITVFVYLINLPMVCKHTIRGEGPLVLNNTWYIPLWNRVFEVEDDYCETDDEEHDDEPTEETDNVRGQELNEAEVCRRFREYFPYNEQVITSKELLDRIAKVRPIIEQIRSLQDDLMIMENQAQTFRRTITTNDSSGRRTLSSMHLKMMRVSIERDLLYLKAKEILHRVN